MMTYTTTKPTQKSETVLYSGDTERPYCAFPSILETDEGILCAFKQGTNHAWDEGVTTWLLLQKDGSVIHKGTFAIAEQNTQNAELLRMRDGSIVCWIDRQSVNGSVCRTGAVRYTYRDSAFVSEDGILTDTAGTPYGYVFDALTRQEKDLMLAMTFPELPSSEPRKTVSLLSSEDSRTWQEQLRLDSLLGANVNESAMAVLGDTLYIFCRGYDKRGYMLALDKDGREIARRTYTEEDGIFNTGRPKLFVRNGTLYALMRNYVTPDSSVMRLDLIRFDPISLRAEAFVVLDESPTDGFYAEPYFDGDDFCVITYKCADKNTPSIVLLRYDRSEIAL